MNYSKVGIMDHEVLVKAKLIALREVYLELIKDHRIPYDFCLKVKEKIKELESIEFVDDYLEIKNIPIIN